MKQMKKILSVMLTAIMVLATVVVAKPVDAGKSSSHGSFWLYSTYTSYSWRDGKWKKSYVSKEKRNKKGNVTESSWTSFWDGGKNTGKTVYKYNKKGYQVEAIHYTEGKKTGITKYSYDSKGRSYKYMYYNAKGKLESTTVYEYDKMGYTCKETTTYTDKSKKKEVTTTKRTYKGNKVMKSVRKSPHGTTTTTFEYYKNGTTKKETSKDGEYTYIYEYGKSGRFVKSTSKSKWGKSVTVYSYDKKGNTKKSVDTYTPKDGEKTVTTYTYSYKYDKNGNHTQSITKRNGENSSKTVYSGWKKFTY